MFLDSFAFCVISFEPIEIQTCSAPQNDCLNLSFVKDNWLEMVEKRPFIRGHRELLDGRLCRPDSKQRPLVSNFTTVAIVKLCCHNFTQIANFMIFFVSTISYRPTDLSLLKEFSKM